MRFILVNKTSAAQFGLISFIECCFKSSLVVVIPMSVIWLEMKKGGYYLEGS